MAEGLIGLFQLGGPDLQLLGEFVHSVNRQRIKPQGEVADAGSHSPQSVWGLGARRWKNTGAGHHALQATVTT
jgi:hypothetical protein